MPAGVVGCHGCRYQSFKGEQLVHWDLCGALVRVAMFAAFNSKGEWKVGGSRSILLLRLYHLAAIAPALVRLCAYRIYTRHRERLEGSTVAMNVAVAACLLSARVRSGVAGVMMQLVTQPVSGLAWNHAVVPLIKRMTLLLHLLHQLSAVGTSLLFFGAFYPAQTICLVAAVCALPTTLCMALIEVRMRQSFLAHDLKCMGDIAPGQPA